MDTIFLQHSYRWVTYIGFQDNWNIASFAFKFFIKTGKPDISSNSLIAFYSPRAWITFSFYSDLFSQSSLNFK